MGPCLLLNHESHETQREEDEGEEEKMEDVSRWMRSCCCGEEEEQEEEKTEEEEVKMEELCLRRSQSSSSLPPAEVCDPADCDGLEPVLICAEYSSISVSSGVLLLLGEGCESFLHTVFQLTFILK